MIHCNCNRHCVLSIFIQPAHISFPVISSDETLCAVHVLFSRGAFACRSIRPFYEQTHEESTSTSPTAPCAPPSWNDSNNCQPWVTAWWSAKSLLVLLAAMWLMHSHVDAQPERGQRRACFSESPCELWGAVKPQQRESVSAGLSVCVREWGISGDWGGSVWGCRAVNLSSTCSQDSGAWCEVSSTRYPIDHIYYIHHSASLFWQLIAPGKEKERIGFSFERRRNASSMSSAFCIFFFFSQFRVFRERSVTDVGSKASTETTTAAEWYSKYSSGKFLDVADLRKTKWMSHQFSALWHFGFAVEVCLEYCKSNLCFYLIDWFLYDVKEKENIGVRNVYVGLKKLQGVVWSGHRLTFYPQQFSSLWFRG